MQRLAFHFLYHLFKSIFIQLEGLAMNLRSQHSARSGYLGLAWLRRLWNSWYMRSTSVYQSPAIFSEYVNRINLEYFQLLPFIIIVSIPSVKYFQYFIFHPITFWPDLFCLFVFPKLIHSFVISNHISSVSSNKYKMKLHGYSENIYFVVS